MSTNLIIIVKLHLCHFGLLYEIKMCIRQKYQVNLYKTYFYNLIIKNFDFLSFNNYSFTHQLTCSTRRVEDKVHFIIFIRP